MKKPKKFVGAVATVTVFGVFTRVLSFIFKIFLSRTLGAEVLGLYQIALSVFFLFASLSATGLPTVLSRKIAEQEALGKTENFSLVNSALIMGICISLSLVIVLGLLKNYIGFLFADSLAQPLFFIMLPALLSTTMYSVIRGWFWGKKAFTAFSITETLEEVLRIGFSVLFISGVVAGISGAVAIAVAFTISDAVVAVVLLCIYFAKGGRLEKLKDLKTILLPSLPVTAMRTLSSLLGTLIAIILPIRLITYGMSISQATASFGRIAGMANPLILASNSFIGSLSIVLVPEMSANGIKKEYSKLNRHLNNGLNFSFLISGIFMVAYVALGREITSLLYNDIISGQYLEFAAYLMLPMGLSQLTQSALNSIGKEKRAFLNYVVGNIFMVVLIYVLPKYIGIYSVAVATMTSLLTTSILNIYSLRQYTGFGFNFIKHFVTVILYIFPSAFLAESVASLIGPNLHVLGLFVGVICGVTMYVLLCIATDFVDIKGFIKLRTKRA